MFNRIWKLLRERGSNESIARYQSVLADLQVQLYRLYRDDPDPAQAAEYSTRAKSGFIVSFQHFMNMATYADAFGNSLPSFHPPADIWCVHADLTNWLAIETDIKDFDDPMITWFLKRVRRTYTKGDVMQERELVYSMIKILQNSRNPDDLKLAIQVLRTPPVNPDNKSYMAGAIVHAIGEGVLELNTYMSRAPSSKAFPNVNK